MIQPWKLSINIGLTLLKNCKNQMGLDLVIDYGRKEGQSGMPIQLLEMQVKDSKKTFPSK